VVPWSIGIVWSISYPEMVDPSPEHEIRSSLEREVKAERWTRLDAAIRPPTDDTGFFDLRPDQTGTDDPDARRLPSGRRRRLERTGLATPTGPGQWMVGLDAEPILRDLGMRGDISIRQLTDSELDHVAGGKFTTPTNNKTAGADAAATTPD
jgi:hypothetical protein